MSNPFFLVGATAVGKTELAVRLAERVGAEIVSADAFQVYQGFDLLTAKPTAEQQRRVPHHLLSYVPTSETYNVARFVQAAREQIETIGRRGTPVLVVGGNGLYVKALTHGLADLPETQPELRAELEAMDLPDLLARLSALDPMTVSTIDARNKRRVVRALEVCLTTGKPFSNFHSEWKKSGEAVKTRGVFLVRERADHLARISQRVEQMFASNVVDEVRRGLEAGVAATSVQILGLREIESYLAGNLGLATCRVRIETATRQYAKRQVTWFKRENCFTTIQLTGVSDQGSAPDLIEASFYAAQTTPKPFTPAEVR